MRGEKVVTFDRPFLYSEGGKFEEGTQITVRAPGIPLIKVHGRMEAAVARSILSFQDRGGVKKAAEASDVDLDEAPEGERKIDALLILAAGYDEEGYGEFLKWLKKTLTNEPRLAYVTGTTQPVTDETWDSIESEHGIDGVMRIMSDFAGFFFDRFAAPSAKKTGGPTPAPSASGTGALSITSTPARSPSRS